MSCREADEILGTHIQNGRAWREQWKMRVLICIHVHMVTQQNLIAFLGGVISQALMLPQSDDEAVAVANDFCREAHMRVALILLWSYDVCFFVIMPSPFVELHRLRALCSRDGFVLCCAGQSHED